jgi:hypothetical protein
LGGADNKFVGAYFGGGGSVHQVVIEGSTRNEFIACTNDNTYGHGYRFIDGPVSGVASSYNAIIGGHITSPSQNTSNTFDGISFEGAAQFNRVMGVDFDNPKTAKARYGISEIGTAGSNLIVGNRYGTFGTAATNLRSNGGSVSLGAQGYGTQVSAGVGNFRIGVEGSKRISIDEEGGGWRAGTAASYIYFGNNNGWGGWDSSGRFRPKEGGPMILVGAGSPEGVATATPGSTYQRTDGGAVTSFYVKESGTGNTGWIAK